MKDPLAQLPGYILRRASAAALADLNKRLAPLKLRHSDVAFLILMDANPGITQSDAGRMLDIQRANMVAFVSRLEKRGLLGRKRTDGRSQGLSLTPTGRTVLAKSREVVDSFEAELLERVPIKLRAMVIPILTALWGTETN